MADRNNVEQQHGEEEVPVEPEQEEQHNEEQDQAERRNQWPVQAQEEQDVHEELAAMDRKVNRILGRTEEIHPIKVRLSSTYSLLHVVDQRTIDMKNVMDRTINGLEQIYNQHKELLKELRTQTTLLQGLYTPRITPNPPSSSSDRTSSKDPQLSCAFCAACSRKTIFRNMSQQPFILKNAKQKLTRHLHTLNGLLQEAREFEEPWQFPTDSKNMEFFLISKEIIVNNLITKLRQRRGDISDFYAECNQAINSIDETFKMGIEKEFDDYWLTKKGEDLLQQAEDLERQLEIRLLELQCQEEGAKRDLKKEGAQRGSEQFQYSHDPGQPPLFPNHYWTMERRLVGEQSIGHMTGSGAS
ncbi:hypothetical protein GCK32_011588 [Trichostrongylus colubriformis]|uniref:Uncharacterized protein n=1 Tax=Trichostrongylus colubriformis TaxID=6319 RepID=A0AAN8FUF1_TRICO